MDASLNDIILSYDANSPLERATTIPSAWYTDPRVADLEERSVFSRNWHVAARADQVVIPGQYVTLELGGEPLAIVKGDDGVLRGFFNVCRHHAAAVLTEVEGRTDKLRCPYHGWTYSLRGELKSVPDFAGVCGFDRGAMGLLPVDVDVWEEWVFVRLDQNGTSLGASLSSELTGQVHSLDVGRFRWFERRTYTVECNWKVFVDNYLDGGYHVPHVHKGLDSVLDYSNYTIENGHRYCLQSSPMMAEGADPLTGAVRGGSRAFYYWIYPNFMVNWYEGALDTNLVVPDGVQTKVIIDYYFPDVSASARQHNLDSIAISEAIQGEDAAICKSVQRGLNSRAYAAGRLSVRRESGEHLFHRLLAADLRSVLR
jgi:choline monooxygenase